MVAVGKQVSFIMQRKHGKGPSISCSIGIGWHKKGVGLLAPGTPCRPQRRRLFLCAPGVSHRAQEDSPESEIKPKNRSTVCVISYFSEMKPLSYPQRERRLVYIDNTRWRYSLQQEPSRCQSGLSTEERSLDDQRYFSTQSLIFVFLSPVAFAP